MIKTLLFLFLTASLFGATGEIILPIQGSKLSGPFITTPASIDAGNGGWRVLFDTTTEEEILFEFKMPANYSSALTLVFSYTIDGTITTGNIEVECEIMAVAEGENPDTTSFDSVNSTGAIAIPATSGNEDFVSLTLTNADSLSASEHILIRISRDVTVGSDATEDLELRTAKITYTTT